ncbi:hypothetical protein FQA47_007263 [Oryzias melastigma]|uniref:Uncharacterized protein n=1 Tax=Oryzias melastigma TaxID=30732 RepID=A0A834CKH6_ORYME|nr:hypothetical protein FQA47_007263 [Oryzias melastigma]
MPDLDALVVAFQTQLSDVMEAVVKTAMFEVTRLVEDVFLVEVKRRRQELESLRMQLQRAEEQVGEDKGGPKNRAESSGLEERADSGETGRASGGLKLDIEDEPAATQNPEPNSQPAKQEDQMTTLGVKEEEVNAPCCSSHNWSSTFDERPGLESNNASEAAEVRSKKAEGDGEDFSKSTKRQSAAYQYPEDQPEACLVADQPHFPPLELDAGWIGLPGLLQSHRAEKESDPVKSESSAAHEEPALCDSVRADVQLSLGTDRVSSSGSPKARIQPGGALGVTVKTGSPDRFR